MRTCEVLLSFSANKNVEGHADQLLKGSICNLLGVRQMLEGDQKLLWDVHGKEAQAGLSNFLERVLFPN